MVKISNSFIIILLFSTIIFLSVSSVMAHEAAGGLCPFSFLLNANCEVSESAIAFISYHLAGFRQLSSVFVGADTAFFFIFLIIAAFFTVSFLPSLEIFTNPFFQFFLLDNKIIFSDFLLSWIGLHEIRDPSIAS